MKLSQLNDLVHITPQNKDFQFITRDELLRMVRNSQTAARTYKDTSRVPCRYFTNGRCTRLDCKFSHEEGICNRRYKTKMCNFTTEKCPYGATCNFAHSEQELRRD